ncbi:hypothetical protein N9C06_03975 [Salibacteraceae bacterium]|nr:hypothetical protein [Salibacteraceae bacterium]
MSHKACTLRLNSPRTHYKNVDCERFNGWGIRRRLFTSGRKEEACNEEESYFQYI